MRVFSVAVLAVAIAAASTGAIAAPDAREAQKVAARPVMICAQDAATRRAFAREHGASPIFVTAREALSLRRTDAQWTSPRCMTERELALYQDHIQTFAAVR